MILIWALLVALVVPSIAHATITCSATATSASTSPATVTHTVPAEANRVVWVAILDRTEAEADPTVVDDKGGTWTKRIGQHSTTNGTARMWWYEQTTLGSTGATKVDVQFSGAISNVLVAGSCYSDTAPLSYVSAATVWDTASTTAWVSNTVSFTAAGVMLCYSGQHNNSASNTMNSANTTELNTSTRAMHVHARLESSGSNACDVTMSGTTPGIYGAALYQETGGATARNLMLLGVGQ